MEGKTVRETVRIYETEGLTLKFEAEVVSCGALTGAAGKYGIVLDRTAFFPGGGGQEFDTGSIDGLAVTKVFLREETGEICHVADGPLEPGRGVHCCVDRGKRIPRMECHTGEHIFSGTVHRLFGLNNVGFHMGTDYLTLDFDGPLDAAKLRAAENAANDAIRQNLPVNILFPTAEELAQIGYRSKKELLGDVRIVSIDGVDSCACCAPHFPRTGFVGFLTVLSSMPYKGGTRVLLLAGRAAVNETLAMLDALKRAAGMLSLKPGELPEGIARLQTQLDELRRANVALTYDLGAAVLCPQAARSDYKLLVYDNIEPRTVIRLADDLCGDDFFFMAVIGAPGKKRYIIKSGKADLKAALPFINGIMRGRGGGKPGEVSGSTELSDRGEIEKAAKALFEKLSDNIADKA